MPIEVGIWRLGEKLQRVQFTPMEAESRLEDILTQDLSILGPKLLLIGRQVLTAFGKQIDLLAMDADGNLVVIELKRDKTPREVVAQALDYGSWVRTLEDEDIAAIFDVYLKKYDAEGPGTSLDDAFRQCFGVTEMPEALNDSHQLMIVAGELDESTERIINYLAEEYGVAVNAVFFRFFRDGDSEYLSRAWLIDPAEVTPSDGPKASWNGEFYVSFGHDDRRRWEDACKYGFIAGGGGPWYSKTLGMLEPGNRIWVNVPGRGYVGVGRVKEPSVPVDQFMVPDESGHSRPIVEMPLEATSLYDPSEPEEKKEHLVRVDWIQTVPLEEAVKEKGFFGNQNTVARPRAKKWVHTVERLKQRFAIEG